MARRIILIIFALIASVAFSGSALSIPVLEVSDGNISSIGGNTTVNLTLSEVPDGLAGYNITVSLSDTSVAQIISVEFPVWASINKTSSLPADSVIMKLVDLNNAIKNSNGEVLLATLTIRGDANGSTFLNASIGALDDDKANMINPGIVPGLLAVVPNSPPVAICGPSRSKCENVASFTQFNGSSSIDSDGTIVSYYWEFDDGTTSLDHAPVHIYNDYRWNGSAYLPFKVILTVTDNKGASGITSQNIIIWIKGDANGDGKVNIFDASAIGLKWGSNDPCADLNNDGIVNILDASTIGLNWGTVA